MTSGVPGPAGIGGRLLDRRTLLGLLGLGAAATALPNLAGCSTGAIGGQGPLSPGELAGVLPNHIPRELVAPDVPGVGGSTAGYTTVPAELVRTVTEKPGRGGTFTAMTPLYGTIPPELPDNEYFRAVNDALGATIRFQITDGNVYQDKLQAVLAAPPQVPDWVCMPSWTVPTRATEAVTALFQDLTDLLAGDRVARYPNLANIPTGAWRYCVFDGRLYGLPFPGELVSDALFYRRDLFTQFGAPVPTTADELLAVAKQLTDPAAGRWGAEDLSNAANVLFAVPSEWRLDGDRLVYKYETAEFRQALEWSRELFASGAVHPEAVADTGAAKDRFESGRSLIMFDGVGGWHEALSRVRPGNPSYDQQAMDYFAADGGDPVLYKGNPAIIFSFLKRSDDPARIEELLRIADFIAAPFGSAEYQLINNGVEGTHFTRDPATGAPEPTERGVLEVATSYGFLVQPPVVNAKAQLGGFVEDFCGWMGRQAPFAREALFYGQQISDPPQYSSLNSSFESLEADIIRGRQPMSAVDVALANWRNAGGDRLREFYEGFLDQADAAGGTGGN